MKKRELHDKAITEEQKAINDRLMLLANGEGLILNEIREMEKALRVKKSLLEGNLKSQAKLLEKLR